MNDFIMKEAKSLNGLGLSKKDALRVASAISGKSEYFITVDNGILSKNDSIQSIVICNPVVFISKLENEADENR